MLQFYNSNVAEMDLENLRKYLKKIRNEVYNFT